MSNFNTPLTQERIRDLFTYACGELFWKVKSSKKVQVGDMVGCIDKNGYKCTKIDNKSYRNHRLIFLYHHGYLPENDVDHIDRDKLNNKIENLREVSRTCNMRNKGVIKSNTSGVTGVFWHKRYNAWVSLIKVAGKMISLGSHTDFTEAVAHRLAGEQAENWSGCFDKTPAYLFIQRFINKERINK